MAALIEVANKEQAEEAANCDGRIAELERSVVNDGAAIGAHTMRLSTICGDLERLAKCVENLAGRVDSVEKEVAGAWLTPGRPATTPEKRATLPQEARSTPRTPDSPSETPRPAQRDHEAAGILGFALDGDRRWDDAYPAATVAGSPGPDCTTPPAAAPRYYSIPRDGWQVIVDSLEEAKGEPGEVCQCRGTVPAKMLLGLLNGQGGAA